MARMSCSRFFAGRTATGSSHSICRAKFQPTASNSDIATANNEAYEIAKSDPSNPCATRGRRAWRVCNSGTGTGRDTEKIRLFQDFPLFAPGEVIEKITSPGAGAENPCSRAHFRDSAGARERRIVCRDAERQVGRSDD